MGRLFGTDGIRGRANEYPITPELALLVGKAVARHFCRNAAKNDVFGQRGNPRAIVGKDTRISGYMLETALVSGLVSMGMDAYEIGPMPTPAVASLTESMCADCGIMITASHNPASDNGIKLFNSEGFKLPDEVEDDIERAIFAMMENPSDGTPDIGKAFRVDDARGRYIHLAKRSIGYTSLKGLKVVLDCANGASYYVAPIVMRELGAEVISTGVRPDGLNINEDCGALHPENMCRLVREHGADIGVSFDGDADRVQFCDHTGAIINCDRIIGLCALDYKSRGQLNNDTVAVTSISNLGLHEAMHEAGIKVEVTNVGDRYVIERMREKSLNLGGEQTGHLIFLEHSPTGDGLISALHVMRIMKKTGKSIAELAGFMREYPQIQSSLRIAERVPFDDLPELSKCIREATQDLGDSGRVIVRYSGTENKLRILAEAATESAARLWHDKIAGVAARELEVIP